MARLDYETMDIHDERAKELAQILINDKAIAILHLIEERALSISEISRELGLPISTVSYHIDKMLKVGLVEIAGKKYGKRLQEVKLYRAANRPILLLPRKSVQHVKKRPISSFGKLHVISLGVAGVSAVGVYWASKLLLAPSPVKKPEEIKMLTAPSRSLLANTSTPVHHAAAAPSVLPVLLAVIAFVTIFVALMYLLRRG